MESYENCKKDYLYIRERENKKRRGYNRIYDDITKEVQSLWEIAKKQLSSCTSNENYRGHFSGSREISDYDFEKIMKNLNNPNEKAIEALSRDLLHTSIKEIEELRNYIKKYDTLVSLVKNDAFNELKKSVKKKKSISNSDKEWAYKSWDYRIRAVETWKKENPINVGDVAIWNSKKGRRYVTVLYLDKENHRAKINTDKGAIMYVPFDTLEILFKDNLD